MIALSLSESSGTKPFEQAIEQHMKPVIEHFEKELIKLRTGRAHPSMIEDIKIECYGTIMSLKEVASISAPEAQMLVIQPWDKGNIDTIERGLALASDLSATPVNDGNLIRLQLQPMSASRRQELIKTLGKKQEESRINVRNARKEFNTIIKDHEKAKKISEDFSKRLQDLLQKMTDKFIEKIDTLSGKKEAEIQQL